MEGELTKKKTEIESGKRTEMEEVLLKDLKSLRKARYGFMNITKSAKDPATQRIFSNQQGILLKEEKALLTRMRQSGMDIDSDSDSGDEMPLISMESKRGLSKGTPVRDSSKAQEMSKEPVRLRKFRYEIKKRFESTKDPEMQRIFLNQQEILWREEQALLTRIRGYPMDSDSGDEMEHQLLIKGTKRDSSKGTEIKPGKEQEMEGELSKEHERLRKVRYQLKKRCESAKDPATHRILLNQHKILWTKEQALLTMMRQSGMEIERDPDSGDEMGRDSTLISMEWGGLSKGTERDSSKEPPGGKEMGQMANDLVVALSSHLEMLRREITFLRTEVTSRVHGVAGIGNKAGQEHTIMSNLPHDDNLLKKKVKVNLPYLGCKTEDVMDFLLFETQQLLYRFNSFASILQTFRIPISSDKIEKLCLISNALVGISELIKSHKSAAGKHDEDRLDRPGWDATWGSSTQRHGVFGDITTLSPMQFTACTPGIFPLSSVAGPALQIYSIKLIILNPHLSWPIDVYGVVAVRDDFDHNLNILFRRSSENCQRIKKEDPFLHLIGPSRAVVADEPVMFQIDLKLKYGAQFEDTASFAANQSYRSIRRYGTMEILNCCCTAKITLGRVNPAIQATIVGVRVVEGEWPFKYGCKVSCLFSPADATEGCATEVVLLDCRAKKMFAGSDGYLSLSRNVVSVGLQGKLQVVTEAYSKSGLNIVRKYHVEFPIQQCQTSSCRCSVDGSTLEIVVAWSRLVMDKHDHVLDGY